MQSVLCGFREDDGMYAHVLACTCFSNPVLAGDVKSECRISNDFIDDQFVRYTLKCCLLNLIQCDLPGISRWALFTKLVSESDET